MLNTEEREKIASDIALAERVELMRVRRPSLWYPPNLGQVAFHKSAHIIRALFPGNGFGKTRAAGTEMNWWARHRHPYQQTPRWPIIGIWCCESYKQFEMLQAQLESECFDRGWSFNKSKNYYEWPEGDRVFLVSYDSDWTNIQGINPDLMVFDEEPPQKLWVEARMRRRGKRKTRYCFAATATQGITWMHDEIYLPWLKHHADASIDEDQAMSRQSHPYIFCWPKGGIDDNPGADAGDRAWYDSHVYNSEAERRVRRYGGFADFSGTPVFDLEGLERQRPNLIDGETGRLLPKKDEPHEFEWIADGPEAMGRVTIFSHPQKDRGGQFTTRYVIGFDSALGLVTGDFDFAVVRDRNTGDQVAEAAGKWGDVRWAEILAALYWYYGEAFIVGERQVGLPTMRRLYDEMGVNYQYFNRDDATPGRRHSDKLGHHRTGSDLTIPRLRRAVGGRMHDGELAPCPIKIRSKELFRQYTRYQFKPRSSTKELHEVHDNQLSTGAPPGDHDDGILADGYAVMALSEVARFPEPEKPKYSSATAAGALLDHDQVFAPKEDDE